jgi:cell division protein FtsB
MKKKTFFPAKYLPYLKNKFLLTAVGFIVWLSFFDRNDFFTTYGYHKKLKSLKKEDAYYREEIKKYTSDLNNLMTNYKTLEKYAREEYLMKKDNEDVYVIIDESNRKEK